MIIFKINSKSSVKIDDEDFERVQQYRWISGKYPRISKTTITMHRFLMNAKPGQIVDHINHDRFDCQKKNLRICTYHQNNCKVGPKNKAIYKGVTKNSTNRWVAHIYQNGQKIRLGYFLNPEDAAKAYDIAAKNIHNEFAYQNFTSK